MLIKAEKGLLVSLDRVRQSGEVHLVRHDLKPEETDEFLTVLDKHLDRVREGIRSGSIQIRGQEPPGDDVLGIVSNWLAAMTGEISIARVPNAR